MARTAFTIYSLDGTLYVATGDESEFLRGDFSNAGVDADFYNTTDGIDDALAFLYDDTYGEVTPDSFVHRGIAIPCHNWPRNAFVAILRAAAQAFYGTGPT